MAMDDQQGVAMSGWDARVDVLQEVPAHSSIAIRVSTGPAAAGHSNLKSAGFTRRIQGHDVGAKPLKIALEP